MSQVVITRRRLLWRTRGRDWDYLFLLRPEEPALPGWLHAFEHIFPDDQAPRTGVYYAKGELWGPSANGPSAFIAAALTDPTRSDFAGRPLQHFFVYMLRNEADAALFTEGWGASLLEALGPGLDAIFAEQRGEDDPLAFSQRLLRGLHARLPEQLTVTTDGDPVDWVQIAPFTIQLPPGGDEKKIGGPPPRAVGPNRVGLILLALLLLIGLRASCPTTAHPPAGSPAAR